MPTAFDLMVGTQARSPPFVHHAARIAIHAKVGAHCVVVLVGHLGELLFQQTLGCFEMRFCLSGIPTATEPASSRLPEDARGPVVRSGEDAAAVGAERRAPEFHRIPRFRGSSTP